MCNRFSPKTRKPKNVWRKANIFLLKIKSLGKNIDFLMEMRR